MSDEATWSRRGRMGLAVVRGDSMQPTLRDGDRLLLRHGGRVRPRRVVVVRFADQTVAVKRAIDEHATASGNPGWWVLSDNPAEGVDSRHRGPVGEDAVIAVALARVWPAPRVL